MASICAQTLTPLDAVFWGALGGCLKCAQIWPYFQFTDALGGSKGSNIGSGHGSNGQHDGSSREPPPRLVVCPKVLIGCAPAEASGCEQYVHSYCVA